MKFLILSAAIFFTSHLTLASDGGPQTESVQACVKQSLASECSWLRTKLEIMYRISNDQITTDNYGISEICDFASKSGSESMQKACIDFDNMGCEE